MARKKNKKSELILCPKCKKPTLQQATNVSGWLDTSLYKCSDVACGYVGRFYITIDPEKLSRVNEEDDDAGPEEIP